MDENKEKNNNANEDNQNAGSDNNAGSSGSDNNGGSVAKTFTQEQVNAMMAREKQQGAASVYNKLGIDPTDDAAVRMFKAFIESQKTEADKQKEQNDAQQAKIVAAEERARIAEAKAEAMKLGAKPECVDDVVALALTKVTENTDAKSVIEEFKSKYKFWFGEDSDDKDKDDKGAKDNKKTGEKGTGASVKGSKGKSDDGSGASGIGKRLASQRRTAVSKNKSYWS